jgi:hypothetical protein
VARVFPATFDLVVPLPTPRLSINGAPQERTEQLHAHGFKSVGFRANDIPDHSHVIAPIDVPTLDLPSTTFHNTAMAKRGWNGWYHCMCNTYGTWLRGDPRGWRTRHHREHVRGDYDHPPAPGTWELTYQRSMRLMKRDPIHLSQMQRRIALDKVVTAFQFHGLQVVAASLDDHHLHLLARIPDHEPRKWLGVAKKNAARELSDRKWRPKGGLWGKRSNCEPIVDRAHQLATVRYILDHRKEGATTLCITDTKVPREGHG